MKQFIQSIKNAFTRFRLQYSKYDDGLYLFFGKDRYNRPEDNQVFITSSIDQNIILKMKAPDGNYNAVQTKFVREHDTINFIFPVTEEYVIYIPKANRITKLTLDDSMVTNPLSDFARMTSLHLLSIMDTEVRGNINELKKLPFLSILCLSSKYIKGINKDTFNDWRNIKLHEID